ncbi:MAG: hypothetical protein AAF298_24690 [Cyanobacteria bacterium P01_A01_bin.40]
MNYTKSKINSNIENKIEFEENKVMLGLKKFWQFSLFYGDYLASLHAKKGGN